MRRWFRKFAALTAPRRKLTLTEFFDRVEAGLRADALRPRRRISGDDGVLVWRCKGVKAGVVVKAVEGSAYVFLNRAHAAVDTDSAAIRILKGVFAGEVIEVQADGPAASAIWMAWADAPAAHIHTFDRTKSVDVPVFTRMTFQGWPT